MQHELEIISGQIEQIKKHVQYYNESFQAVRDLPPSKELEFYKRSLVQLLNLQCELTARQVLLELRFTPTTTQALNIIGAPYIAYNGQIYITE